MIAQVGQVDDENAVLEVVQQVGPHLQSESSLARAARPGEGEQADALAAHQPLYRFQLLLPAYEFAPLHGQVVRPGIQHPYRREVRGQAPGHKLEDVFGSLQIFQAVLPQVA